MEESAPQRYELPNAPPNKALVFLPWKRKGDNEATAGAPPKAGAESTIFTSHLNFLIFNFPFFRTFHRSRPQRIDLDRSHKNVRIHVRNGTVDNYTAHSKITPYSPIMSLIWVLPRITETSQKNFLPKFGCFLVC